jgi:hypothetical protein
MPWIISLKDIIITELYIAIYYKYIKEAKRLIKADNTIAKAKTFFKLTAREIIDSYLSEY